MLEAFRVGPVVTAKGQATLFAASLSTGVITSIAASAAQALAELRRQAGAAASRLVCEPALAAAGRPLGFQPAALSPDALEVRATLATMLALGPRAEPAIIAMVPRLIDVGVKFHAAAPWRLVAPETPIEITLERLGTTRRCVASVFRVASGEACLALARHPRPPPRRRGPRLVRHPPHPPPRQAVAVPARQRPGDRVRRLRQPDLHRPRRRPRVDGQDRQRRPRPRHCPVAALTHGRAKSRTRDAKLSLSASQRSGVSPSGNGACSASAK